MFEKDMPSRGVSTLIAAGIIALAGVIAFVMGIVLIDDPLDSDREVVFTGSSGEIELKKSSSYYVYIDDAISCNTVSISVNDGVFEYFSKNCERNEKIGEWKNVGGIYIDTSGDYTIDSDAQLRIYEYEENDIEASTIIGIVVGEGLCCISFIMTIVAIVLIIVDGNKQQVVTVVSSNQIPLQYMQPQNTQYVQPENNQYVTEQQNFFDSNNFQGEK